MATLQGNMAALHDVQGNMLHSGTMLHSLQENASLTAVGVGASLEALRDVLRAELLEGHGRCTAHMLTAFGGSERCLERFLVARKHNVVEAAAAFRATAVFRREELLDTEGDGAFEPSAEIKERVGALWPGAYCGFSVDHCPVQLFRFGGLDVGALMEQATEAEFRQYYLWWMERSLALQAEGGARAAAAAMASATAECGSGAPSSSSSSSPMRGMIEVYDCAGLSVAALLTIGAVGAGHSGLLLLKRVLSIGQLHYPENLRLAIFINAPLGFASLWALVSSVLSERTVAKIHIRRDDGAEVCPRRRSRMPLAARDGAPCRWRPRFVFLIRSISSCSDDL